MMNTLTTVILIMNVVYTFSAKDIPSYFPSCKRFDPNLNDCLLKATEKVKPFLARGVPELNLPPIEPFNIPEVLLQQGTSALNFKAVLKNVLAHGLTDYTFSRFDFDVPNMQFFCDCTMNKINLEGLFTVNGKVLIAPIEGSGKFTAAVDNATVSVYQKVELIKKRGLDYVNPVVTNSTIHVGGPKANLKFDGNTELDTITNKIINDNVDELFEDLRPVLEQVITKILEDLLLRAFESQIPFDKLYSKE